MKTLLSAIPVAILLGLTVPVISTYAEDSRSCQSINNEVFFREKTISTIQKGVDVQVYEILEGLQNRKKGYEEILTKSNSGCREYKQVEYDLKRLNDLIAKVESNIRGGKESIAYNQGELSSLKKSKCFQR